MCIFLMSLVFFGHLTDAVEELRYQHTYVSVCAIRHVECNTEVDTPDSILCRLRRNRRLLLLSWTKYPRDVSATAASMSRTSYISTGLPNMTDVRIVLVRLLNTIRQGDYYLITEDFDSCQSCPLSDHPFYNYLLAL